MTQAEARGPTTTTDTDAGAGPLRTFIVDMLLPEELERDWVCKQIEAGRPPWGCSCLVLILLGHEGIYLLGEGFSHEQGEDQGGISIDLRTGPRSSEGAAPNSNCRRPWNPTTSLPTLVSTLVQAPFVPPMGACVHLSHSLGDTVPKPAGWPSP